MAEGEPLPQSGVTRVANLPVNWQLYNAELKADLDILHSQLSFHFVSICTAEELFAVSLLMQHNLLRGKCPAVSPHRPHRLLSI